MATLPSDSQFSADVDGGNIEDVPKSGFEGGFEESAAVAALVKDQTQAAVQIAKNSAGKAGKKLDGFIRRASSAEGIAAGLALAGGLAAGAEPAMREGLNLLGAESALVQSMAGAKPADLPPGFVAKLDEKRSAAQILQDSGAAEVGDGKGQVPTRHRPEKDNQAPAR